MVAEYRWVDEPGGPLLAPGGVVLSSFPSAGLATTVAAQYIIRTLQLSRTGTFESAEQLPVAIIQSGQVHPAVRAYGRADFALVVSEFPPLDRAMTSLARTILDGAEMRKARMVVCLEGAIPHPYAEETEEAPPEESLWVALSHPDPSLDRAFSEARVRRLEDAVLGGMSGAMLVEGLHRRIPVAVLLVSVNETQLYPDHRAGAALIEALDRLLPALRIDTAPLRTQAEKIERALRAAMSAAKTEAPKSVPESTTIYQ
jgi:predicted ATP-grasp superfamily ATP-dependent carboligase